MENKKGLLALLGLCLLAGTASAKAIDAEPNEISSPVNSIAFVDSKQAKTVMCDKAIADAISKTWSCSHECGNDNYTEIGFAYGDDGKIYEPSILKSSQDDQYDAECLECVSGLTPLVPPPRNHTTAQLGKSIVRFGPSGKFVKTFDGHDVQEYLRKHGQSGGTANFILVHKIPLSVLWRYPGMFTQEELITPNNLLEITRDKFPQGKPRYVNAIANLYAYWGELFKKPGIQREDILFRAEGARMAAQ